MEMLFEKHTHAYSRPATDTNIQEPESDLEVSKYFVIQSMQLQGNLINENTSLEQISDSKITQTFTARDLFFLVLGLLLIIIGIAMLYAS
jgi:hypothetical protein